MKYTFVGKDKRIAFGRYPEVSLADARQKREEARQKLRDGDDPPAESKRAKLLAVYNAANTFGEVAAEYLARWQLEVAPMRPCRRRTGCLNSSAHWPAGQLSALSPSTCWWRSKASKQGTSTRPHGGVGHLPGACYDTA